MAATTQTTRVDETDYKRILYDIYVGTAYGERPIRPYDVYVGPAAHGEERPIRLCMTDAQLAVFDALDPVPIVGSNSDPDVIRWHNEAIANSHNEEVVDYKRILYDIYVGTAYGEEPIRLCMTDAQRAVFDALNPVVGNSKDPDVIQWHKEEIAKWQEEEANWPNDGAMQ
jgi:hypothetical protein